MQYFKVLLFHTILLYISVDGKRSNRRRSEDIGLNCFTCVSINGTDKDCDDPVQPAWMNPTKDCMVSFDIALFFR